jgi:hypothetical protein
VALLVSVLTCAVPSVAAAQQQFLDGKLAITFSVGGQPGSQSANRSSTFSLYGEEARVDTAHDIEGGTYFDIGGSYKVWESLALGLSYARLSNSSDAAIGGLLPHPLFTNQPRSFTASATDLDHVENAIHIQAIWLIPFTDKVEFSISGGPSIYTVTQEFSLSPGPGSFTETVPYNTVTINSVETVALKESGAGFNIGADASYAITKTLSGLFQLRYTRASVDFAVDGSTVGVDVGNAQIGVGLRVKF